MQSKRYFVSLTYSDGSHAALSHHRDQTEWGATQARKHAADMRAKNDPNIIDVRVIPAGEGHDYKPASALKSWVLHWGPTGQEIGTVKAQTASAAKRKAPLPYRKYLGEIGATEQGA